MSQRSFYNTTEASGSELDRYQDKAEAQEDKILGFLASNSPIWFTAEELQRAVFIKQPPPLTSVRRALTNLYKQNKIVKSDTADGMGLYGRPVHSWKYRN